LSSAHAELRARRAKAVAEVRAACPEALAGRDRRERHLVVRQEDFDRVLQASRRRLVSL
jgi:hypothetical protein